jgi:hypothetical protein
MQRLSQRRRSGVILVGLLFCLRVESIAKSCNTPQGECRLTCDGGSEYIDCVASGCRMACASPRRALPDPERCDLGSGHGELSCAVGTLLLVCADRDRRCSGHCVAGPEPAGLAFPAAPGHAEGPTHEYSDEGLRRVYAALVGDLEWVFGGNIPHEVIAKSFFQGITPVPQGSRPALFHGVVLGHSISGVIGLGERDLARLRELALSGRYGPID